MRLTLFFFLLTASLFSQSDGYFQQETDYAIEVRLDDRTHTLHGRLELTYTNHAPVALDSIVFHLWPRAYCGENTAFARQQLRNGDTRFHFAAEEDRGDLDSLNFRVAGTAATFRFTTDPDIGVLQLPAPLAPGASTRITTPFRVTLPASFSRLGHVGESYQITQWYPKPAVYDRDGWHAMPYLDQGEFYSEFGDFRVTITLPENYVVAATGVLQEAEEREWLLACADSTRRALDAAGPTDLSATYVEERYPASSPDYKTLTYTAEKVHDFAWFADKRFGVLHDTLHPNSHRGPAAAPLDVWSFFTKTEEALWKNSTDYIKRATRFYSEHVGPYPYPQVTGVQSALSAGGGMEYPMITVIGLSGSGYALDEVLAHEIGHNWFYGVLGSDERGHSWMDEGLNSYYEGRYTREFYPQRSGRFQLIPGREVDVNRLGYRYMARLGRDQAPDTPSDRLGQINYWIAAYSKPALILEELEGQIGPERVDAAFRNYFADWQFRHPRPADFLAVMERETGTGEFMSDALTTTQRGRFNTAALHRDSSAGFGIAWLTDQESARTTLFVTPVIGVNAHDGFLLGAALHNRTLEPRPFEFLLAPLYGLKSKRLAGFAGARYRLTRPVPWLQRAVLSAGVQRFSDFEPTAARLDSLDLVYGYTRTAVKAEFFFDHPAVSLRASSLYSQFIHLDQQRPDFSPTGELLADPEHITTRFLSIGYRSEWAREINPAAYSLRLEYRDAGREQFTNTNSLRLEGTLTGGYQYQADKFVSWRFFGGYFLYHAAREGNTSPATSLSLVDNAASDYRYDDLYFGRNRDNGYEQQLELRQGGFRAPVSSAFNFGRSNTYLTALNLDGDLPLPLPIGVFLDAGAYGYRPTISSSPTNQFNYVAGLSVNIFRDQFHLYLPLVADADTRRLLEERGNLLERMSIRLNLRKLLPWQWLDTLP